MPLKGLDVQEDTTGHAHDLLHAGYQAVGFYCRPDRASKAMIDGLHSAGVKVWSIYEKGLAIDPSYFTEAQGVHDGKCAAAFAELVGQPQETVIFVCVDYDSNIGEVYNYIRATHDTLKDAGYLMGIYGNGSTIGYFQDLGYCHAGWLSQSQGFNGYQDYLPRAAIVQGPETKVLVFDVDLDDIKDEGVLW